jgi:hypothetical protein
MIQITDHDRAAWKAAHARVEASEAAIRAATAPLRAEAAAAQEALDEIEERTGVGELCISCSEPLFETEPGLHDSDGGRICEGCSPDYAELLRSPETFTNMDEEPMTPEQARYIYDAHIAAGGKPTDKFV